MEEQNKNHTHRHSIDLQSCSQIINKAFTYHPPKDDQVLRYNFLRDGAKDLAVLIDFNVPDSREKSLALTKLEETVMWANAGIARNE